MTEDNTVFDRLYHKNQGFALYIQAWTRGKHVRNFILLIHIVSHTIFGFSQHAIDILSVLSKQDASVNLRMLTILDPAAAESVPLSTFEVKAMSAHVVPSANDERGGFELGLLIPMAVGILVQTNQTRMMIKTVFLLCI